MSLPRERGSQVEARYRPIGPSALRCRYGESSRRFDRPVGWIGPPYRERLGAKPHETEPRIGDGFDTQRRAGVLTYSCGYEVSGNELDQRRDAVDRVRCRDRGPDICHEYVEAASTDVQIAYTGWVCDPLEPRCDVVEAGAIGRDAAWG